MAGDENSVLNAMDESKNQQDGGQKEFKEEIGTEKLDFAISEPMREEQIENAVRFLSHPKVRDSPVIHRRSFLEKKGLNKDEIDEAFRRVPDPPLNATARSSMGLDPQVTTQIQHNTSIYPSVLSVVPSVQKSRFLWRYAFLGVGIFSASVAGTAVFLKSMITARLKAWILKVVEEGGLKKKDQPGQSSADVAAKAAKEAASAVTVVAKATQELLNATNEEKRYFEALLNVIDSQVKEMKLMGNAIHGLEDSREPKSSQDLRGKEFTQSESRNTASTNSWGVPQVRESSSTLSSTKLVEVNGTNSKDTYAGRTSSESASMEPMMAPHSKSYMEIIQMIQRGEKPPNIRDINDMPPDPNQPIRKPLLAPKPKPWEAIQKQQQGSGYVFQSPGSGQGLNSNVRDGYTKLNVGSIDSSEPQWRKKSVRIIEGEPQVEETKLFSSGVRSSEHLYLGSDPSHPLTPAVEDSIGEPTSSLQKQQTGDENLHTNGEHYNLKASELVASLESSSSISTDLNPAELAKQELGLEV